MSAEQDRQTAYAGWKLYETEKLTTASLRQQLAEVKNWSACEAAANIPAVLEYVGQLEQERNQLCKQGTLLREALEYYANGGEESWVAQAALDAT